MQLRRHCFASVRCVSELIGAHALSNRCMCVVMIVYARCIHIVCALQVPCMSVANAYYAHCTDLRCTVTKVFVSTQKIPFNLHIQVSAKC